MKKLLAITLSLLLTYLPVQQAQAALDYQNLSGTTLATAGSMGVYMGLATGTAIAVTGGLALGLVGAAILIDNALSENSNSSNTALTIELDPNKPFITPSGWTAPTGTNKQPTPPTNGGPAVLSYVMPSGIPEAAKQTFTDITQAANFLISYNNTYNGQNFSLVSVNATNSSFVYQNHTGSQNTYTMNRTCPAGYSNATATCTLATPTAVIKPKVGRQQIVRQGNTFVQDAQINPSDKLPATVANVTSNKVVVNDSNGNTTTVEINSDGSTTITRNTVNGDGTSTSTKTKLSAPDASGKTVVEGQSTEKVAGSGTQTTNNTNNYSSSGGGTGTNIDISSLNKEATQAQINAKLGDIKTTLEENLHCDDCTLPEDKSAEEKAAIEAEIKKSTDTLENAVNDYGLFKDMGWSNWIPEFPTGSCSPFTGTVMTKQVTWDICPYVAKLNELIGWLFNLFGAWTLTSMFFRKD